MVVDADLEVTVELLHAGAVDIGALEEDDQVETAERDLTDGDPLDLRHLAERRGGGVMVDDAGPLSQPLDHAGQGQARAEGVAVRPQMTGDDDPSAGQDFLAD